MFKGSMPAAFKVKDSIACGVQGLKVQCLRRSRFKGSMPAAFKGSMPATFKGSCFVPRSDGSIAWGVQCSIFQRRSRVQCLRLSMFNGSIGWGIKCSRVLAYGLLEK
jgi:hypothetical protein